MSGSYDLGTARGVIEIVYDDSGSKPAQRSTEELGAQAESVGSRISSAFKSAFTAVSAIVVAASATMITSLVHTGVAYNSLVQTSTAAFTTILGSAAAAKKMMADISAFAMTSPFPRQAFISATQQMLGFGIASKDVIPILKTINDATAALGGNAQTVAEFSDIFATIQSQGKITGQEIQRFGQIGVNAVQILAKAAGKTGDEIRKEISSGSIDAATAIKELTDGMNAQFAGAAENVKNTFPGAIDRVKGAWRDFASAVVDPFVSKGGGGIGVVALNSLADIIRALIPQVAELMNKFAAAFGPSIEAFLVKIANAAKSIDFGSIASGLNSMSSVILPILGAMIGVMGPLLTDIPFIGKLFEGLTGPIGLIAGLIGALIANSPALRDALGTAAHQIGKAFESLKPVFDLLSSTIGEVAKQLGDTLAQVITTSLPPVTDFIKQLEPALKQLIPPLGDVLKALIPLLPPLTDLAITVLPLLTDAIKIVTPLLVDFFKFIAQGLGYMGKFANALDGAAKSGDNMGIISGAMSGKFGEIAQATAIVAFALGKLIRAVSDFVTSTIGMFTDFFNNTVGMFTDFFTNTVGMFTDFFTNTVGMFVDFFNNTVGMFTDFFTNVAAAVSTGWQGIMDFFQGVFDFFSNLLAPLQPIWDGIFGVLGALGQLFAMAFQVVVFQIGNLLQTLAGFFVSIFNGIVAFITPIWNGLVGFFNSTMNSIIGIFTTAWNFVSGIITTVMTAVIGVVVSVWNAIVAFLTPTINAIKDIVVNAWNLVAGVVTNVMKAVWGVLTSVWNSIVGFIKSVVDPIGGTITHTFNGAKDGVHDAMDGIWSGIKSIWNTIAGFFSSIGSKIVGFFANAGSWLFDAGKHIIQGFIDGISNMLGGVKDILNGLTGDLSKWKGPEATDKVLLTPVGELVMTSFMDGLSNKIAAVKSLLRGLTSDLPATMSVLGTDAASMIQSGNNALSTVAVPSNVSNSSKQTIIQVTWHAAPNDKVDTKQQVLDMLGRAADLVYDEEESP
jgi:tape measure domain-containing protein